MLLQVMLFVYIENKMGDRTQPWGTPVFKTMFLDVKPLTTTCWGLSNKKYFIHKIRVGLTSNSRRRSHRMCGSTVLKAEEKSINKICVWL